MGRGAAVYLSYTALLLLSSAASTSAVSSTLFDVNIDESPAPSPQDGPPFSAYAIRNKGVLPYEIVAVVASYIGSVLILGTLLLTVGRTLRKRAQNMASKPQEMVKPMSKTFGVSPVSPGSTRGWYKLRNKRSVASSMRSGHSNHLSPSADSTVSFDQNVIQTDRQRRQEEMERLYSAVMLQEEAKSRASLVSANEVPGSPPGYQHGQTPQFAMMNDPNLRHLQQDLNPASPTTPRSPVRAIYPPHSNAQAMSPGPRTAEFPTTPLSPEYFQHRSPRTADFPNMPQSPEYSRQRSPRTVDFARPPLSPDFSQHQQAQPGDSHASRTRTPSMGSANTLRSESSSGVGKRLRKSLRNIKISAPLQIEYTNDERTPLSPRFYTDPGIPPDPPTARTNITNFSDYPPTTPGTAGTGKSWPFPNRDGSDIEEGEQVDEVRDLPQPHPNRLSSYQYNNPAQAITNAARSGSRAPVGSINNNSTLPFRQMNEEERRAAYAAAHPLSPVAWNQQLSAGPLKTTFLEANSRRPGVQRTPKTGGRTPMTGLPTPYSAYMPFSPVTPVTPHLTSRAERKQREKEEKAARGAIVEEERVVDEKEMWGSGY